jgi:hypothetical protein
MVKNNKLGLGVPFTTSSFSRYFIEHVASDLELSIMYAGYNGQILESGDHSISSSFFKPKVSLVMPENFYNNFLTGAEIVNSMQTETSLEKNIRIIADGSKSYIKVLD